VSGHEDGKVRVWNLPSGAAVKAFNTGTDKPVNSVLVTTGGTVVAGGFDNKVYFFDLAGPDGQMPTATFSLHTKWVWRLALSPDQKKVASASEDGTVRIFGPDGVGFKNMNGAGTGDAVLPTAVPRGIMGVTFLDNNTVAYTTDDTSGDEIKTWSIVGFGHP